MKKILFALGCASAIYAADTLNQVDVNVGMAGSGNGAVNAQFQFKDAEGAAAKLFLGYQSLNKEFELNGVKASNKTKKEDYEISAYLGKVMLDNGTSDLAGYLIGGYHISRVNFENVKAKADGFLYGAQLEVTTNITETFRAGASAEYKNIYSGNKDFNGVRHKVKDEKIEVLAKVDVMVDQGFYIGGKAGAQKRKVSVGASDLDKSQFLFFVTLGSTY